MYVDLDDDQLLSGAALHPSARALPDGASRTASAAHHQRLLENVFRASSLVAPTTHDGVDLFYQLLSAHRSVPPREPAYLIPEVTDRFLSGERIGRRR
jgi:hypothetical protein